MGAERLKRGRLPGSVWYRGRRASGSNRAAGSRAMLPCQAVSRAGARARPRQPGRQRHRWSPAPTHAYRNARPGGRVHPLRGLLAAAQLAHHLGPLRGRHAAQVQVQMLAALAAPSPAAGAPEGHLPAAQRARTICAATWPARCGPGSGGRRTPVVRQACGSRRRLSGTSWGMLRGKSASQTVRVPADLGPVHRSGRRGRRFKSGHPDQKSRVSSLTSDCARLGRSVLSDSGSGTPTPTRHEAAGRAVRR